MNFSVLRIKKIEPAKFNLLFSFTERSTRDTARDAIKRTSQYNDSQVTEAVLEKKNFFHGVRCNCDVKSMTQKKIECGRRRRRGKERKKKKFKTSAADAFAWHVNERERSEKLESKS